MPRHKITTVITPNPPSFIVSVHNSAKSCCPFHSGFSKALLDIIHKNKSLSNRSRFVEQTNGKHTERDDNGNYVKSCFIHEIISCGE